jgi:hypothetical protein
VGISSTHFIGCGKGTVEVTKERSFFLLSGLKSIRKLKASMNSYATKFPEWYEKQTAFSYSGHPCVAVLEWLFNDCL